MKKYSVSFIVPEIDSNSSQHFAPYLELVNEISKETETIIIGERGDGNVKLPYVKKILFCDTSSKLKRIISLITHLEYCKKNHAKVVIVRISKFSGIIAGIWCLIRELKMLIWHSGAIKYKPVTNFSQLKTYITSYIPYRIALALSYKLITGPKSMKKFYQEEYGIAEHNIEILHNNYSPDKFFPVSPEIKKNLKSKYDLQPNLTISLVHRLSPIRNHLFYLPEIFKAISGKNITFLIVGEGPETHAIKSMIEDYKLSSQVKMLGKISHSNVNEIMQLSDIFINPSYVEGFPRVIIEAMACGITVLATNAGGTADLFPENLKKLVIDKDNPTCFAQSLLEIVRLDGTERNKIGQQLLSWSKQFATNTVASQYISLINKISD